MAAPTTQELERILRAIDTATHESDFVDSWKMDSQLIEGTRYQIRLNEKPDTER